MKVALVIVFLFSGYLLFAQEPEKKNYTSKKINDLNISIDGNFNEPEWQNAKWENQFIQHEPEEGKPPCQQTEFAILYDDNNIYVAVKSFDSSPDSISMRVSKRDETDGDLVGIMFPKSVSSNSPSFTINDLLLLSSEAMVSFLNS